MTILERLEHAQDVLESVKNDLPKRSVAHSELRETMQALQWTIDSLEYEYCEVTAE